MNNKPTFRSRLLRLLRPHATAIIFYKLRIYQHRIQLSDGLEMSPDHKACTTNGNHLRMYPLHVSTNDLDHILLICINGRPRPPHTWTRIAVLKQVSIGKSVQITPIWQQEVPGAILDYLQTLCSLRGVK